MYVLYSVYIRRQKSHIRFVPSLNITNRDAKVKEAN